MIRSQGLAYAPGDGQALTAISLAEKDISEKVAGNGVHIYLELKACTVTILKV